MPRELTRVKPQLEDQESPGGLEEFTERAERVTKDVESSIRPGWSSEIRPKTSKTQIPRFSVSDDGEEVLIKFLEDRPFAPIYQHWVQTSEGRRAFTCAGREECPMCHRGHTAKASDWFNVVVIGETPELKVWIASPDPSAAIKERADGKRTSPIHKDGLYFAVSKKKGTNGFFSYTIDPVREDDLADWPGYRALTDAELDSFDKKKFDGSIVKIHTVSELQEAARKYLEDE